MVDKSENMKMIGTGLGHWKHAADSRLEFLFQVRGGFDSEARRHGDGE